MNPTTLNIQHGQECPRSSHPPALDITALEKRFPRFTLGPINLSVPSGLIYGLIGPNGAGKTTLLDQIFGMGLPDAGRIQVNGLDHLRHEVEVKRRTAYVGPDLSYAAWGKVGRAIRFVRSFHPDWDDALASRLMQTFGIMPTDRIATLSFGGRMKLALLLAMAWRPHFLVLDEPTTGLDAHAKKAVFAELLAIVKDEARTVLLSTHQISDLERFADHVGILHQGRLLTEGTPADLMQRHVQVEFLCEDPAIRHLPGLFVQENAAARYRAVMDTQTTSIRALTDKGAGEIRSQPLSLEELFIALTP
ncbi:ABC-2 type transport system ATP-binding protein [Prosthecobacter fusiformis]|uniref:ABC-2 type transport system ATP-binding protein n=1 Tax=Prosthecobacter fusiformis TaxID=48464 RepID=A0A4R7ST93_9BACT|nr:ABC transporter ATP-binding protein [Prosthecobacter fusiformis]TDU81487.1 ABC-2 type transport system ATP-binding protein [Prosthecobacter fusiformis]